MRVRRRVVAAMLVIIGAGWSAGWAAPPSRKASICAREVFEGEVRAGQQYVKAIGGGLELMLEPLPSGWILRIVPVGVARPTHDYAELATPPYKSVSPLLISTDFSFRAQDAVAWNPRRFRFAADGRMFAQMSKAYGEYMSTAVPSAAARDGLARLVGIAPEGTVQILDARLVPGTADQAKTAAMVASHFDTTAHSLEQPADGRGTALGRLTWMRFRISLELPDGFRMERGTKVERHPCTQPTP